MTALNGNLLYTKDWKKEKKNLRNVSKNQLNDKQN